MSSNYKNYEFQILVENKILDIFPSHIQFSIKDSIHKLFPEGILSFVDSFGIIQERSFILDGTYIQIDYKYGKDSISCPFNAVSEENTNLLSTNFISGNMKSQLKHNFHWTEEIISKVYKNKKISEIISEIFSKYNFIKKNIFETGNKLDWYQPLIKNSDFIEKILLPNSYSPKSNDTPYFCFINNNNEVNFTTYNEMIRINSNINIVLAPQDKRIALNNNILSLNRFITGNELTEPLYYHQDFEIDSTDGSLIEHKRKLIDFPKTFPDILNIQPPMQVPIKKSEELYKSYHFFPPAISVGEKDNNIGRYIYFEGNAFFLERMRIMLPLNLKLLAGKVINLNIATSTNTKSIRFCGNYIIESSEHIWNGKEGFTIIDIGRKNYKIPRYYENFNNVWGRLR